MIRVSSVLVIFAAIDGLLIKRNLRLEFDEMFVTFNSKYIDVQYYLQNNSGTNEMFIYGTLKMVEEGPLMANIKTLYETANGQYELLIPVVSFEMCSLARNVGKIPIFFSLIRNVRKSGKVPTKCPVQPGSYNLVHFKPQPQLFPVILPAKKFRFDLEAFRGLENEFIYNMSVHQTFREM